MALHTWAEMSVYDQIGESDVPSEVALWNRFF